jgi:DUF971 family protein
MPGSGVRPVDIELDRTKELRIRWVDGEFSTYPLWRLRQACPCAACRTEREAARSAILPVVRPVEAQRAMATVERVELVGRYALRIVWRDGHDAGIYDYPLLRALAAKWSEASS